MNKSVTALVLKSLANSALQTHLDWWQAELLGDLGVLDLAGLLEGHSLYTLGHVRG